ncbi:MAG: glycosyltransferase family 4 protein [Subdoligranulum sp.]|nr:glycosyltransferase family 4 protein [Subdoligranulum sp.]
MRYRLIKFSLGGDLVLVFCFFSAQYLPTVGGVERYTLNLAKRMVQAGHKAIVVTSALHGLPAHEQDANGIEIYRLPVFPLMNGRFPFLKPCPAFFHTVKEVWAQKPDLCVVQTRMYSLSLYAALSARRRQIPAIVIEHSTGHMPMNQPILNAIGQLYEHLVCGAIHRSGAHFYGVSQAVCEWLRHFGVQAEGTLYNSVDPEDLQAVASAKNWREALQLSPETKLAVFVGRIIPEKGVKPLVSAFARLHLPGTALLVAGDGPQLPELRRSPEPGVYYLGSQPYPDTLALLQQADVYCLPTTYAEGFPTTLLEAAACGCAILCTNTAGSAELLPDESYGLRIASPDESLLLPALQKAFTDAEWHAEAAKNARQNLLQHFTWQATAEKLLCVAARYTLGKQNEGDSPC